MKFFKWILPLFIFLGFFSENLKAEIIILENEKIESFSEQDFKEISEEQEWLGLLYLQEVSTHQSQNSFLQFSLESFAQNFSGELCIKSTSGNLESNFQVGENLESHQESCGRNGKVFHCSPQLVDSWKVLGDAGETGLSGRIDDITKVDDYLKNNPTKTAQNVVDDIKANGWQKWNDDFLKNEFLTKIGKELPDNWNKFSLENNVEFAERLKAFRGNDDLTFDANFRGGEGQLFESSLTDDLVLKRWFSSRVKDMPESIRLLKEAESLVKANPALGKLIDVVSVGEKGSDWVVRGFNARSVPLKNMVSDPVVAKARQKAIEIISNQPGEISDNILKKLNKNSANVHWSIVDQKLLIIDMQ